MLRLKIEKIIKSSNLTLTKSRKQVLIAFLQSARPLSLKHLRSVVGKIDRVTLFRILSIFEQRGIIHSIRLDNGQNLYALCNHECDSDNHNHKHVHFQCTECDDVSCLNIENFPQIKLPNHTVHNLNINASGICINCS